MKVDIFALNEDIFCRVNCWRKTNVWSYSTRKSEYRPNAF